MAEIMNTTPEDIEEIKKKRFIFLHKLYSLVDGVDLKDCRLNAYEIGDLLGFDRSLTSKIWIYLHREELIRRGAGDRVSISHKGIMEVEEILSKRNEPTEHFPSLNVTYVGGDMISSQVVQDSPGAEQSLIISVSDKKGLSKEIDLLKESLKEYELGDEHKLEIQAEIETIEKQLTSPKPKRNIIAVCGKSLINIIEIALGSAIAANLLANMPQLMEIIKQTF